MDNDHGITGELREWAEGNSLRAGMSLRTARDQALAIADRIDEAHQKALSRAGQLLDDAEQERDSNYANWQDCKQKVLQHNVTMDELSAEIERLKDELEHRIELPKDADGEYIHIGDMLEITHGFGTKDCGEVTDIHLQSGKCAVSIGFGDEEGVTAYPEDYRHHHAPTVEDVLEELLREYDRDDSELTNGEIIERFAAKLRLAGDAE